MFITKDASASGSEGQLLVQPAEMISVKISLEYLESMFLIINCNINKYLALEIVFVVLTYLSSIVS